MHMIAIKYFSVRTQVCFILFASFALAVLQNVTVDDAVLTGPVVPLYLPSTDWAPGNDCTGCLAKPDPSLAYNGTWHDTTFHPNSTVFPSIQITFVGNGLYIFFILANNLGTGVTSATYVNFILDNVQVSSFNHTPTTSQNFDYNQTVYANNSIPYGEHTMTIVPVNDSTDSVLILFDYLIFTTDSSTLSTSSSSPTSTGLPSSSSGPNIGAIVGGTVGGVAALVFVTVSVICYHRYRRRTSGNAVTSPNTNVVEPFISSPHTVAPSSQGASLSTQAPTVEPRHKQSASISLPIVQPSIPPSTPTQSSQSSAAPSSGNAEILEQVGMLRTEVARLRRLQDMGWSTSEVGTAPPEYS